MSCLTLYAKQNKKARVEQPVRPYDNKMVMKLCECIYVKQFVEYSTLIQLGMILKCIGSSLELWDQVSTKSKPYKQNDCCHKWYKFKTNKYTIVSCNCQANLGSLMQYSSFIIS